MNPTNPAKPGYATSELWISVLAMGLTLLAAKGVIDTNLVDPILKIATQIYTIAVACVTIFGIASAYIKSRTTIKTTMLNNAQKPNA